MPWVRLDDRFPSHRKVALLSDRAFRLYVSSLCWASENLTEGVILDRELAVVSRVRGVKNVARELETAGLWDRISDGWRIHDFLEYNPDRAKVKAAREANAARQKAFRDRKKAERNATRNAVTESVENTENDAATTRRRHDGDTNASRNRREEQQEPQVTAIRNGVTNASPSPTPTPTPTYVGGGAGSERTPTPRRADGLHALPDDFAVNDTMRRWSLQTFGPGVDVDHETQLFVSHFRAEGGLKRSWPDAWQKWMRKAAQYASERQNRPSLRAVGAYQSPEERGIF